MAKQIDYPYIPEGREFEYVSFENPFMQEAFKAARDMSTDLNYPTGAVVVFEDKIVGRGANQGFIKNEWFKQKHKKGLCTRKLFKIKSGQSYWICPGCVPNHKHAEGNAVRDAQKNIKDLKNFDVYLWGHWWACEVCWQTILDANVKDVYLLKGSELDFNSRAFKNHHVGDFEYFEKQLKQ